MNEDSRTTGFLALFPSGDTVEDPNKRSIISYTREFLLSLAKPETTELPREVDLSILRGFGDASGLLSPTFCDSDFRCDKSVPQQSSLKVLDKVNRLLHKSDEPYRPPHCYKALRPSNRDCYNLHNSETSGSSDSTSQEKTERERWRKDVVKLPKQDKWHFNKHTDCDKSSEAFLMSPASGNFSNLKFSSNAIIKQLAAPHKPSLIQGAVKCDALQPTILPGTTKNCSTQYQLLQDAFTNNPVNLWQKPVYNMDASLHLPSMLEKDVRLKESEASSNFNVGYPDRIPHVLESQQKSRATNFLSLENCGNLQKNHFEVYEKGAKYEVWEDYVFPPPVEDKKHFLSMVEKCESAMVHCEGILSLHKQIPPSSYFEIQQELEINSSSRLDEKSSSGSELCLPDEDSLIIFDEPFLMPDEQNWDVIDESIADKSSPSSPRDMVEKLVEAILNDESSPAPHPVDSKVHYKSGLEGFCHSHHAEQWHAQFHHNHLSPERDRQANNCFQRKSIDIATYSRSTHHSFPSNTISQPSPLCHDELRMSDHDVSLPAFQQMTTPDKPYLCSFCGLQRGVTPDLYMHQMVSCKQKLNSLQDCTFGYQEPSYRGITRPNPDSHTDGHNNQAVVDSLFDLKLRAWPWHPYLGGF